MDGTQEGPQVPAVSPMGPPMDPQQPAQAQVPSPQDQVTTVDAPQSTAMLQAQTRTHHDAVGSVLDALGRILGGSKTHDVQQDPTTGKITITPRDATRGEQWSRAATAALSGLARGAATPAGPGSVARAAGAGIAGGMADAQQQQQSQLQNARQAASDQQKAQLHNANMALLNQQVADSSFQLAAKKANFVQGLADRKNQMSDRITANPANKDLGVIASAADLPKLLESQPDAIQHHVNGQIYMEPEIDADGKVTGTHAYYLDKEWSDRRNTDPVTMRTLQPGKNIGDAPTVGTRTIPAGAMTNGQIMLAQQASDQQLLAESDKQHEQKNKDSEAADKHLTAVSEAGLRTAQGAEAYAGAQKNRAEAGKASVEAANASTAPGGALDTQAQMLVHGDMDPSQMTKRSKTYDATIAAANALSLKETGKPFDMAKATSDYKYSSNKGTKDTLNYLNSLTGHDGNGGNLSVVRNLSAKLPRSSSFPALNDLSQWAALEKGNPQIAGYRAALVETSDQIAKILQGGNGGATSDAKMRQANDLFRTGFTNKQMQEVANTLQPLLHNRKMEMVGDNRYLMREYGQPAQSAPAPQSGGVPANTPAPAPGQAHPQTHSFSLSAWQRAYPNGDANAARAAAQQQGYTVVQ